jgi:peptide-methionine (R)-S-oxide reductase
MILPDTPKSPRRRFLKVLSTAAIALRTTSVFAAGRRMVKIAQFDPNGQRTTVVEMERVVKTDAEWKKLLTKEQFDIARRGSTEFPFTGKYNDNHADGLYHCICCSTVLFDSKTKFNSGTGWPSFWQPIAKENVTVNSDHSAGMVRDEVVCTLCEGHLGHVFDDGPKPTHLRYCMNSDSLKFVARGSQVDKSRPSSADNLKTSVR